ncbi:hypothetical protein [Psychrobacter frigidicola]|uniref:hypothetical protein n=1 Tax=Psychrobacter frigidicola TaxID=45611 RepID=UPI001478BB3C|nr:hypothetical protein [Psychrobacter frigidicola]
MNQLAIGQRLPLSNLDIDETSPITLKFTRQSPIEMSISCFALNNNGHDAHDCKH